MKKLGSNVAILADLQGPKLRVGMMENDGVILEDGQEFSFVTEILHRNYRESLYQL